MRKYGLHAALLLVPGPGVVGYFPARTANQVPDYDLNTAGVTDDIQRSRDAAPVLATRADALVVDADGERSADAIDALRPGTR